VALYYSENSLAATAELMNKTSALVLKARDPNVTQAENHQAFGSLVQAFQDMAFACAYSILGDVQLSEDAAQEGFISAWQRLSQLRRPEAFPSWLRRILLTECSRLTRGKRIRAASLADHVEIPSNADDPQRAFERVETRKAVFTAIQSLPEHERMVVMLFYVSEYSHREISAFLGVPATTVAKRLYSARARLKDELLSKFRELFMSHRPSMNLTFAERVRAGVYDQYVGQYRFELRPDLIVTIKREGDMLFGEAGGQRNVLFSSGRGTTELSTKEFDGRGRFARNRRGEVTHFIYFESEQQLGLAKKIS